MGVYINGIAAISAQKTFNKAIFVEGAIALSSNRTNCVEPEYSEYFSSSQMRRMSRIIRMGVTSALLALKEAGLDKIDGVIVGTGFGCLEDTDTFLTKLVLNTEEMLNPTAFIHSTHNTISSQIALLMQCKGYNSTYVHRNISFESALLDAMMLINESPSQSLLAGGADELTDRSYEILNRIGNYKNKFIGEGSAFFTLSGKQSASSYAKVKGLRMISFSSLEEVMNEASNLLAENDLIIPDLLISGHNGNLDDDKLFDAFSDGLNIKNKIKYKQLCGEYNTSTAFALWLASIIIKEKEVPFVFNSEYVNNKAIRSVMIHNHTNNGLHHSLILVSEC